MMPFENIIRTVQPTVPDKTQPMVQPVSQPSEGSGGSGVNSLDLAETISKVKNNSNLDDPINKFAILGQISTSELLRVIRYDSHTRWTCQKRDIL